MATFVIAGKGTHPLANHLTPGSITVSGSGNITCVDGKGTLANAHVKVVWQDGTTDDNVFVNMAHCTVPDPFSEGCQPPGD